MNVTSVAPSEQIAYCRGHHNGVVVGTCMSKSRLLLVVIVVALIGAFFAFDLGHFVSLEELRARQESIVAYRDQHMLEAALIYFAVYIAVTALSLPGAAIMTLAGGAFFGLLWGTVLVSFASTIGATLAFLL